MSYVAFVPLRGGSKGIPGKNIRPLAGRPLCRWAIEAASAAERIERVVVATDSDDIASVVRSFALPKVQVVGRSADTATDTASTESAMIEFARRERFGHIVLVQATSPLLTADDLNDAIGKYEHEKADSLLTVVEQRRFTWSIGDDGGACPSNYDPRSRPRRQDCAPYLVENGAFYISEREGLIRSGSRLFGRISAYVMPGETLHEIDEHSDWTIVEALLEERKRRARVLEGFAARARRIKVLLTDVDGVLTDAGMYYSEHGDELKKFNTRDGKGFELLRSAGIRTGMITSESTQLGARRGAKLGMDWVIQAAADKVPALERIVAESGVSPEEIAYIGDDLADIPVLRMVGLAACPSDAIDAVRRQAHYVCTRAGGAGCVRELVDHLLACH